MTTDFLLVIPYDIDFKLTYFAVAAFVLIGVALASMILFTKAKFVGKKECEIKINDDPELTIHQSAGSTLLNVLTSNGIPVPSPCGGKATCKQCRVQIVEGANAPLQTDIDTFPKSS